MASDSLLNQTTDPVERARLLASRSEGSGDWIKALPLSSVGLKLDNSSVRIAVGLRLGTPLVHPHQCCCGTMVTTDGHHGLSCRKSAGRQSRHSQINDIILRAFHSAGIMATREPVGLCYNTAKRPDGVTMDPWKKGHCLAWDATCPDTFAQSHVISCSINAGAAAKSAEDIKNNKYADLPDAGIDFVPVAIETTGVWGSEGFKLVCELGRKIGDKNFDKRSSMFLRQRISLAIQRGNAYSILATFKSNC
jgi:hypothetical protein